MGKRHLIQGSRRSCLATLALMSTLAAHSAIQDPPDGGTFTRRYGWEPDAQHIYLEATRADFALLEVAPDTLFSPRTAFIRSAADLNGVQKEIIEAAFSEERLLHRPSAHAAEELYRRARMALQEACFGTS